MANIMFVSVKERTRLIGIKKAIGATRFMIMLEFLIEAIVLCLIGGAIGLLLVFGTMELLALAIDFNMFLSFGNVILGLILTVAVGLVSGIIPAGIAAAMDPVEAIRK